ncbi:MAG TPA: ATP-binding cassette domain-containing protein [Eubacteriales bacterium]|nr:ATP-binding cassette domain-containing protein [Clostridia bacterium]HRV73455.1 ATP-binding cassette domain-containing protein [Eubacteriales bacterium]
MADTIIDIKGLCKVFGEGDKAVHALSDVDLQIERGEIFGLIGLSGAGKSTLVRCVNLLERPSSGSVCVLGHELTAMSEAELRIMRRRIGMIFQQFNLLAQRTALENVMFPLLIAKTPKREAREKASKLLALVDVADKASAYPAQLSGGQKQRVAIARALAADPEILLCDEATSALDPANTASVLKLLSELNRKLGVTIVVITHEMKVIEQICQRVAILDDSRVVELGAVEEVFRRPKSKMGRKLVLSGGERGERDSAKGCFRIVFNGEEATKPVVSELVLLTGNSVNILFADTKSIGGRVYGQMLLDLPEGAAARAQILGYLDEQGIFCEEVESDA